ncbi:MAG TPA: cupredoxin domain-containing protein [Kofleriaceae bacterium]|jgi:plastocyanin domain-containing protein|nr:cupredoxin domain-containing protein [Kofleriaceae bacterium]
MIRALALSVAFSLVAVAACKKEEKKPASPPAEKTAPVTAGTVAADGVRKVNVEASKDGYTPDKIAGKPGEKLVIVFKRTIEGDCLSQVQVADGKPIDLPMNTPVEVPVTVPQAGELAFACGMGMFKGTIVAAPNG